MILVIMDNLGTAVEQYDFDVDVRAEDVKATYSDLETMFVSALLRLGMFILRLACFAQRASALHGVAVQVAFKPCSHSYRKTLPLLS
jgi:hypothetical protein